jgi:hypothetical protein
VKLPNVKYYNKVRNLTRQLAASQAKLKRTQRDFKKFKNKKVATYRGKGKGKGKKTVHKQALPAVPEENLDQNAPQNVHNDDEHVDQGQPVQHIDVTPRKAAVQVMQESNLSPVDYPNITKDITAYKTLVKQIALAPKKVKMALLEKKQNSKSRVASRIASEIGVSRKSVLTERKRNIEKRQQFNREKMAVIRFLKKAPNSTPLPGKRDVTSKGIQKYSLNETMSNLHLKYRNENRNSKISLATFCRQRPPYIKTIQWANRRQCLCVLHQNAKLKLSALHNNTGISNFLDENTKEDVTSMLCALPDQPVKFREWQKEDIEFEGKTIKKLKLKNVELSKQDFSEQFEHDFEDLREHVTRMRNQFDQLNQLKKEMPRLSHATCHMDYSENYACRYQDEPAQAFYDSSQVTVHPMIINYNDADGNLKHKSFVGISSERAHNAPTTFAFIRKLVPLVKQILPQLSTIHYITDSPVSQYRNKSITKIVANHSQYFPGVNSTWDYLEAGHGKGPCDGVGGAIKRYADIAVKKGEIIGNGEDFFQWAKDKNEKMSCIYVSHADVSIAERMLHNATAVKGLSKCHSVRSYNGYIHIRHMSCYNKCCEETPSCAGWQKTNLKVSQKQNDVASGCTQVNANVHENTVSNVPVYEVGCIVEASYNGKIYRGQIEEFNKEYQEYEIKFLKKNRAGVYICPKTTWSTWVSDENIIKLIE